MDAERSWMPNSAENLVAPTTFQSTKSWTRRFAARARSSSRCAAAGPLEDNSSSAPSTTAPKRTKPATPPPCLTTRKVWGNAFRPLRLSLPLRGADKMGRTIEIIVGSRNGCGDVAERTLNAEQTEAVLTQ